MPEHGGIVGVTPPFGITSANARRIDSVERDTQFSLASGVVEWCSIPLAAGKAEVPVAARVVD